RADRLVRQSELDKNRYAEGDPPENTPDYILHLYIGSLLGSKVVPGYIAWLTRSATNPEKYQAGNQWQACPEQARLARCVFGNPFRPITINSSWLTSTVLALANGIYEEKAFDRMPILADALQDAGCDNENILNHCRQPGDHIRGCWAIDLLLAKQ
ncbi:MAG TPA: hypothetical protein VG122_05060, partial [Gemmata sp.]|nr:hypothetical protein [Gemmata sp.]